MSPAEYEITSDRWERARAVLARLRREETLAFCAFRHGEIALAEYRETREALREAEESERWWGAQVMTAFRDTTVIDSAGAWGQAGGHLTVNMTEDDSGDDDMERIDAEDEQWVDLRSAQRVPEGW